MPSEPQSLSEIINGYLDIVSTTLHSYILIALLIGTGLYFFTRSKVLPPRTSRESIRVVSELPDQEGAISSFRVLTISTTSQVGAGNIVSVGMAIVFGGVGSVFWMWVIATLGVASAFIESTLAQIHKKRGHGPDDHSIGGPAYCVQIALKQHWFTATFALVLILTYMGGFNMLAPFNAVNSFSQYSQFDPSWIPYLLGGIFTVAMVLSIFGGTRRLTYVTGLLVPTMALIYPAVGLIVVTFNHQNIPLMFLQILEQAFDFRAIFSGFAGSVTMYGIKRGLYSNEAGAGSAPNAAVTASVSHPVKQGLVQMFSVFIDTMVICMITIFIILSSGVQRSEDLKGAPLITQSMATVLGDFALLFMSLALLLFVFTTIIGNFYHAEVDLYFLVEDRPTPIWVLQVFRSLATVLVFMGDFLEFSVAWNLSDILMGIMALINLPVITILGKKVLDAVEDYTAQRKVGKNPGFRATSVGTTDMLDHWH